MVGADGWKRYSEGSLRLFDVLLEEDSRDRILHSLARIVGETVGCDRSLIFDVSYERDDAACLTEWLRSPTIAPSAATYPLALFRSAAAHLRETRDCFESHREAPHPTLVADGSANLVHEGLSITSLLWHPFMFRDDGFYLFAINHVAVRHAWDPAEIEFMRAATRHVSMALVKLELIDERTRAEQAMYAAQRLESIGVLAGGVAHDFNNLMVAVISNAELLTRRLPEGSPLAPLVGSIHQAGRRAAALAGQLLAYAGKAPAELSLIDPRTVIGDAVQLVHASFPAVAIDVRLDELPAIEGNRAQVDQVVMNLVVNAAEAFGDKPGRIEVRAHADGKSVELVVRDDGPGMDDETLARIFDPFFTTKLVGRGLGLSAVQGIVRQHGGAVAVTSTVGKGTTFTVRWPAAERELAAPRESEPSLEVRARTLLVVDDEPTVLSAIVAVLEDRGFRCISAVGGAAALAAFADHRAEIDGALVDLTMPPPGGREVLAGVRADRPDLPVVLLSGYAEQVTGTLDPRTTFVHKPFAADDLVAHVLRVLQPG